MDGSTQAGKIMIPAWVNGTLEPVEKLEAHQRGLRHKAVSVFVFRDDAILIQQRALGKYHTPGLWANTCCTHPAWGEDALSCAQRRLNEELGITGLDLTHQGEIEYRADVGDGLVEHELAQIFIAHAGPGMPLHPNPDEVMATRWMALDALSAEIASAPERFTPWLQIYLAEHHTMILGDRLSA